MKGLGFGVRGAAFCKHEVFEASRVQGCEG